MRTIFEWDLKKNYPIDQTINNRFTYNYFIGIIMLYMSLTILSGLTVYKIVSLGPFLLPAGIFTTPLTYCLSNVVTEVYGYPVARNLVWWFIICSAIFTFFAFALIHLPSPPDYHNQSAYELILGSMPRVFLAGILGTLIGMTTNNYLVSKFKILMGGRHYWIRSIISTCGGEIVYNVIAYPIMMLGIISDSQLFHIFISVTIFKIMITATFLLPECLLAHYLKIKEKINIFDYNVNYNIFRFKIEENTQPPRLSIIK